MTASAPSNVLFGHDITGPTSARPANADRGILFFDQTLNQLLVFDGSIWQPVGMLPFVYDPGGHVKPVADSGLVGTIDLGVTLPAKALIFDGMLNISTAFAGAGASLAIQSEAAGDILATTAVASLGAGLKDVVPVGTAATAKLTTVARNLKAVVSGANFTDGTVQGFLRWAPCK